MYQYREVKLGNRKQEKGILVIDFDDPKMNVVGEFLMADGALLGETILTEMNAILQNEKTDVKISGNRCGLHIMKDETVINDMLENLYDDGTGLPEHTIETTVLKDILIEWLQVRNEYYANK